MRTQINMFQAIAPNAFFIFASTFPTNDAIANLALGAPVTFYQGLGDFNRDLRDWSAGLYAQDEWRISTRFTLNYGLRYESVQPFTEIRNRLNGFVPGVQSEIFPNAPAGVLFPGDAQFNQYGGTALTNFANPYAGKTYPAPNTLVSPSTVFALDPTGRASYSQNWNFGVQRSPFNNFLVELHYLGAKGTHLPRNIEANPAVYGPGATAQNADQRRIYAGCSAAGGPCALSTIAELVNITNSTCHAGQFSISRRFTSGLGLNVSYWWSKSLDSLSSMNMAGASSQPLAGANDLAQNPFDLRAEHGPSLFDARHRLVASGSWHSISRRIVQYRESCEFRASGRRSKFAQLRPDFVLSAGSPRLMQFARKLVF